MREYNLGAEDYSFFAQQKVSMRVHEGLAWDHAEKAWRAGRKLEATEWARIWLMLVGCEQGNFQHIAMALHGDDERVTDHCFPEV